MNSEVSEKSRHTGYFLDTDNNTVTFIFDPLIYGIKKAEKIEKVDLTGSFNGWTLSKDWELFPDEEKKLFTVTKKNGDVNIPGNSGVSEFKFHIIEKSFLFWKKEIYLESSDAVPGYSMNTNNLVVFPETDIDSLIKNIRIAEHIKSLDEFNLSTEIGKEEISNVRLVPGTTMLYRGYHPFKLSRPDFETERTRSNLVKKAFEEKNIQSVITLCGDEKAIKGLEEISAHHKKIRENGNQLFIDTDYNIVYYHSDESDFGKVISDIVKFINSHPGPYYIHCRLGTDRTGTTSASMAALCGASWNDICEDYEKTNRMGIKEFRDHRLLQYSFEHLLGKKIEDVKNLQEEFSAHFLKNGYLSEDEINQLRKNLCR